MSRAWLVLLDRPLFYNPLAKTERPCFLHNKSRGCTINQSVGFLRANATMS
jgi:hypothetical protein